MNAAYISLIGTLFGGIGVKFFEYLFESKADKDPKSSVLDELRLEIESVRLEADDNRDEADQWRDRYYVLVSLVTTGDLKGALDEIQKNAKD